MTNRNATLLLTLVLMGCTRSSRLEDVFSDFSIGVPNYQTVESFTHPADVVKGDYFSLDLVQSSNQFSAFISRLGVAETNVLSPVGVPHLTVTSKINPKYPWFLSLKAEALAGAEKRYRIHVEGRQPYD